MKKLGYLFTLTLMFSVSCRARNISEPTPAQEPELANAQESVDVISSLAYAEDNTRQKLDIYLPLTGEGPYPTIMAIHGGGFYTRSKKIYEEIGPHFARKGYAFVAINYRLTPDYSYPDQVADSFCALAWLHANRDTYGFDPRRMIVMGGSAGGYLASMLGTVDNPEIYLKGCPNEYPDGKAVHAAVIFYGLYDFTNVDDLPESEFLTLNLFWGGEHSEIPLEKLEEMSPIMHVDGNEPPFIILHGLADSSVPSVLSERFANALSQVGVDAELVLLPDVGHAFELKPLTGEEMTFSLSKIDGFLDRVLVED